jgi:hypothetical protein
VVRKQKSLLQIGKLRFRNSRSMQKVT